MLRGRLSAALAIMLLAGSSVSWAEEKQNLPIYEPGVIKPVGDAKAQVMELTGPHGQTVKETLGPAGKVVDTGACVGTSRYEVRPPEVGGVADGNDYGDRCRRLQVMFGPIIVKPGQDDVLIQPVTFEKPMYDGMITRFEPGIVNEQGFTPPVEDMHLHHGTWLNTGYLAPGVGRGDYGEGPWIASGEEKTIVTWPKGYGLHVTAADTWLFLHMIHQATFTSQSRPVFVYYNIDYIPIEQSGDITNTRGIWLDGGGANFHQLTETYSLNPIFNSQRGFGTGGTCRFPIENCAAFNSSGNVTAQQGQDVSNEGGWMPDDAIKGYTKRITTNTLGGVDTGTLVLMGGHTHNGGLGTEVELFRDMDPGPAEDWQSRLISQSEAYYWQDDDPATVVDESLNTGGLPLSWDYSQTGSTVDHGWTVNVKAGDRLRLTGVYDSAIGSWYEQMSIVMTWVVPGVQQGKELFADGFTIDQRIPNAAIVPNDANGVPLTKGCDGFDANTLCTKGQITHGQIATSGNHSPNILAGDFGESSFDWTAVADGLELNDVAIGGFTYGLTDAAVAKTAGVPYVNLGDPISFHNLDSADYMWHTITRCALPCDGRTTVDYPFANAGGNLIDVDGYLHDPMDFDSTQLGYGLGPTQRHTWTYTPTETGTFTYFCRVHPNMRGVFRVK